MLSNLCFRFARSYHVSTISPSPTHPLANCYPATRGGLSLSLSVSSTVSVRNSPIPAPKQTASILKPTGSIRKGDAKRVTMCDAEGNVTPTFIEVLNEKLNSKSKLTGK